MARILWTIVLLLPLTLFIVLGLNPAIDPVFQAPHPHFYIVSATALLAGAIAVLVAIAARKLRDARAFFLALSYASIGLVFGVHGLATPDVFMRTPGVTVGLSAVLSLMLGAVFLALASLHFDPGWLARIAGHQGKILVGFLALVVAYGVLVLTWPEEVARLLAEEVTVATGGSYDTVATRRVLGPVVTLGIPLVTIVLYLYAAWGFLQSFRLSGSRFQFAMFVATILLAEAVVSMVFGTIWRASWWLYHLLMLASFLITLAALILEYSGGRGLGEAIQRVVIRDRWAQLEGSYGPAMLAFIAAVEAKDPYTRGHGDRVARVSVTIGEELGLPARQLRLLAQAGVLHDVGKIAVPEPILNKPGKLTDQEFIEIKKHPGDGARIVSTAATLRRIQAIIRAHHERWDGRGYPDGLKGEEIPMEARIIAVADVYDALTSYRSYRKPWVRERVLEEIRTGSGTHFDPRVAAAMERVIARWGGTERLPEQLPPLDERAPVDEASSVPRA